MKFRAIAMALSALLIASCGSSPEAADTEDGRTIVRYQGWASQVTFPELAENLGYFQKVKLNWVGNTISEPPTSSTRTRTAPTNPMRAPMARHPDRETPSGPQVLHRTIAILTAVGESEDQLTLTSIAGAEFRGQKLLRRFAFGQR